jgi:hypothetical protein
VKVGGISSCPARNLKKTASGIDARSRMMASAVIEVYADISYL